MGPAIDIQHLTLSRGGQAVLHDVSLRANGGSITALIGPSGSGKSSLLRCVNRLSEPPSGTVFIDGEDVTAQDVIALRRRVGMVFQQVALFPGTVADNIAYGRTIQGRELTPEEVARLLHLVDLSPDLAGRDSQTLSGGQAQRVAIARTLANEPEALLLDEPTSALDPNATRHIETTLTRLRDSLGLTLLWVTHDPEQAARVADHLYLLVGGRIEDEGDRPIFYTQTANIEPPNSRRANWRNNLMLENLPLDQSGRVAASLSLVVVAIVVSRWQRLDLEKSILVAVIRAFVQLTLIGYALTYLFDVDSPALILIVIGIMTAVAGYTSGERAQDLPHGTAIALGSIGIGAVLTLALLVGLHVFSFTAQQIIPIAGMVIGSSMTVCSLVMRRVQEEAAGRRLEIETALALGATRRQAADPYLKVALQAGMIPIIDTTKTVGLIKLPGAMTGMILAGAPPLEAVQIQMIVMFMLMGAAAITGLTAAFLTYRQLLNEDHQVVLPGSAG
ncbi:MAG: iron export ABC transporter permease subunit FetB [Chloroflexota bacterium]